MNEIQRNNKTGIDAINDTQIHVFYNKREREVGGGEVGGRGGS